MRRHLSIQTAIALAAFCLPLIPKAAIAQQDSKPQKPVTAYRFEINVRELENGRRVNSRNYMLTAQDDNSARIRVGNRVPYQTAKDQYQYTTVGMNIDCRPHEHENGVAIAIVVDFSSVPQQTGPAPSFNPVLRSDTTEVNTVLAFDKPTLVASLDDVESNRRYEIEVTATKVM